MITLNDRLKEDPLSTLKYLLLDPFSEIALSIWEDPPIMEINS